VALLSGNFPTAGDVEGLNLPAFIYFSLPLWTNSV